MLRHQFGRPHRAATFSWCCDCLNSIERRRTHMKPKIGFSLVTYDRPQQTLHLCKRLNVMFGEPPIVIHHDFSQAHLDKTQFPKNVDFVKDWHKTSWGVIQVVDAQIASLRLLNEVASPDWSVLLSTTCYPIQTAEQMLADLSTDAVDAFFDLRPIADLGQKYVNEGLGELAFNHPRYAQGAFNRDVALPLISPAMARRLKQPLEAWVLKSRLLTRRLTPFDGSLKCFGGDTWFTASRSVVELLITESPLWRRLHDHYASRIIPEESFFHTLLGNTPGLRLSPDNLRYTDWRGCYAHPRALGREDIPRLLQSTHHFARKFDFDPSVFAELDEAVYSKSPRPSQDRDQPLGPPFTPEWQFVNGRHRSQIYVTGTSSAMFKASRLRPALASE